MTGSIYGYVRVSTREQNEDRQLIALREVGVSDKNLFLLNKTDKTVMFSVDDASVNGFMADPFYATSVSAGKCAFSSMAWSDTTLEENGITEVEEIEVLFRAYDADDFMGEDFANEVITLNP